MPPAFVLSWAGKRAFCKNEYYSSYQKMLIEKLCAGYGGCFSRRTMLRPVLVRSFWVLLFCALAFYLLCRDTTALLLEKKEFLLAGNSEAALAHQRVVEILNLFNGVLLGGVLYVGYIIWLGVCSPVFVRRFRDAGLNPKIYSVIFMLFALSGILIDFSGLAVLPYEDAMSRVVRSLLIETGGIVFTLLLLAALSLRPGR